MVKQINGWVSVSDHPADQASEASYFRHKDIQRVSMVEDTEDHCFSVLVPALGAIYSAGRHERLSEATRHLESLTQEISESHS